MITPLGRQGLELLEQLFDLGVHGRDVGRLEVSKPGRHKKSDGALRLPELTVPAALLDQMVKGPMTQHLSCPPQFPAAPAVCMRASRWSRAASIATRVPGGGLA